MLANPINTSTKLLFQICFVYKLGSLTVLFLKVHFIHYLKYTQVIQSITGLHGI